MPMAREPIPLVVFACDRPAYLRRALDAVFANDDEPGRRIFVSQDGTEKRVSKAIKWYGPRIEHLTFAEPVRDGSRPDGSWEPGCTAERYSKYSVYYRISQHYGWAFRQLFDERGLEGVIVLEDDLEIAPDFFNYFRHAIALMQADPTIWTVSAWNDNGYPGRVEDPARLCRSDFFPGLGWYMPRALWDELRDIWPLQTWDDWIRLPEQRKDRSVVYPEVSRTYNYGRRGSSHIDHFDRALEAIVLNTRPVDFSGRNLDYITKDNYDEALRDAVSGACLVDISCLPDTSGGDIKLLYHGEQSFDELAEHFGIRLGFRDVGLARCSYDGVVSLRDRGRNVYLVSLSYLAGGNLKRSSRTRPAPLA